MQRLDGDKAAAFSRIGELAERNGADDRAIDAWRQVAQATKGDGSEAEVEARKRLMGLYHDAEKWNAFIEVVKQEMEAATGVGDKVELLKRMIAVYRDKLGLDHMVSQTWQQILAIDPDSSEALDALEVQYERLNRWPDLIGILQKKAERAAVPAQRISLNKRIARLFVERFSNQAEAIKAFEAVLALAPEDGETLTFLKHAYDRRRDWGNLVRIRRLEAETLADDEARAEALTDLALIAGKRLGEPSIEIAAWEKVRKLQPDNLEPLSELSRLYAGEERWEQLCAILERKAKLVGDDAQRIRALQQLAEVRGELLGDEKRALASWRRVLQLRPEHAAARKALGLDEPADDDPEQSDRARDEAMIDIELLEAELADSTDKALQADLHYRIGRIWEERLDRTDNAMVAYQAAFKTDASCMKALGSARRIYEDMQNHEMVVRLLDMELRFTEATPRKVELGLDLGFALATEIGDIKHAREAFSMVLDLEPDNEDARRALAEIERFQAEDDDDGTAAS